MILSIMTFRMTTFSIMTFSITTFSIMTFSIMTFSITTYSITTLDTTTFCITILKRDIQHNGRVWMMNDIILSVVMPNVFMLSVVILQLIGPIFKFRRKWSVVNMVPGLHFCKLQRGSISWSVLPCKRFQPSVMQHYSLLGPFVSSEENEVLWMRLMHARGVTLTEHPIPN